MDKWYFDTFQKRLSNFAIVFQLYIPIRTLILQLKKEIASKQCTGFVIYEDLSICRMEDAENLIFNIFC